jgi:ribosomal-protein-serine acetyltransferase
VHLTSAFAFLETVVATASARRRGWGIEASRLFVSYAMDALDIHRIEAKAYSYNAPSINALTRNHFTQEGVLREAGLHAGERCDILVYSILHDEIRRHRDWAAHPYMGFWEHAR